MGGEHCGEVAAETAVRYVNEYLQEKWSENHRTSGNSSDSAPRNCLVNAVQLANEKIWEISQALDECAGMGTTISIVLLSSESVVIGNIGDSRVYLFRDGELQRLTRDDTLVSTLVDEGKISLEKARAHPLRNIVTLAVGRSKEINVQTIETKLQSGDQLLLSSDGLHGVLSSTEIAQIIGSPHDPQSKAHALVDAAKREGGPDNISCIVVECP